MEQIGNKYVEETLKVRNGNSWITPDGKFVIASYLNTPEYNYVEVTAKDNFLRPIFRGKDVAECISFLNRDAGGIREIAECDFWTEATAFAKELVVSDIEQRFTDYCKKRNFNHSETLFFRKMLADAIEMNFIFAMLKNQNNG